MQAIYEVREGILLWSWVKFNRLRECGRLLCMLMLLLAGPLLRLYQSSKHFCQDMNGCVELN